MIRLRLIKGLSHVNAYVSATQKNPIVTVETEEAAAYCVAGGFFEIIGNDTSAAGNVKAQDETAPLETTVADIEPEAAAPAVSKPDDYGTNEDDELSTMTVAELRAYAETTGVDLGKLTKKADIIAAIRKAEAE